MSEQAARINRAAERASVGSAGPRGEHSESYTWPSLTPLPDGLPPVPAFDFELLPPLLHRRVEDISERMQAPRDFPAVAAIAMLSSVVGRRCGIRPKREDDWTVIGNIWAMAIGRPGIMKTPALEEVMRPLRAMQARAMEQHEYAMADYHADRMVREQQRVVTKDAIKSALKKGNKAAASSLAYDATHSQSDEPSCRRYIVNDATVEKLGELLNENRTGLLLYRDELTGFFRTLERSGHEADRAFYLESWNGDGSYTYDRIGRGTLHIPSCCLAVLGSIQPGPLSDLVRGLRGSGDDGLLQRFQLAVWPDASREWRNVDRRPDQAARADMLALIERLDRMPVHDEIPALRFDAEAQELFDIWRAELERRLRGDVEHPTLEAHLAKYRSLVPSLALLFHLVDAEGPVTLLPLQRAVAWAEYLEPHARRIYAPAISPDMDAARALAAHMRAGDIGARFALRDIYNKGWSGLATRDEAAAAVQVLIEYDWLREHQEPTPGRPRTVYECHPVLEDDEDEHLRVDDVDDLVPGDEHL
ncbi:hypothetical protein BH24PSE2_BH24PSE2_17530 [soil metagenome]